MLEPAGEFMVARAAFNSRIETKRPPRNRGGDPVRGPIRPEAIRRMIVRHLTFERLLPTRRDVRKNVVLPKD